VHADEKALIWPQRMNGRSSPRRARRQAARPSVSPFDFAASLRSADPLRAADATDFSDFTMKAGASSEAVNVWPPKWKSFVRHSSIVPRVRPCGVTYDTRSPTFDDSDTGCSASVRRP
jgi:hypothetical protein